MAKFLQIGNRFINESEIVSVEISSAKPAHNATVTLTSTEIHDIGEEWIPASCILHLRGAEAEAVAAYFADHADVYKIC